MQLAAVHNRSKIEIAIRRVVDGVAQQSTFLCGEKHLPIDFARIRCRDDERLPFQVGFLKAAPLQCNRAILRKLANCIASVRSDHAQMCAGSQQAGDLFQCDIARADNQAGASLQLQKNWKKTHRISFIIHAPLTRRVRNRSGRNIPCHRRNHRTRQLIAQIRITVARKITAQVLTFRSAREVFP